MKRLLAILGCALCYCSGYAQINESGTVVVDPTWGTIHLTVLSEWEPANNRWKVTLTHSFSDVQWGFWATLRFENTALVGRYSTHGNGPFTFTHYVGPGGLPYGPTNYSFTGEIGASLQFWGSFPATPPDPPDTEIDIPDTVRTQMLVYENPYSVPFELHIVRPGESLGDDDHFWVTIPPGERWAGYVNALEGVNDSANIWAVFKGVEKNADGFLVPSANPNYVLTDQFDSLGAGDFSQSGTLGGGEGTLIGADNRTALLPRISASDGATLVNPQTSGETGGVKTYYTAKSEVLWKSAGDAEESVSDAAYKEGVEVLVDAQKKHADRVVEAIKANTAPSVPSEWSPENAQDTAEGRADDAASYGSSAIGVPSFTPTVSPGSVTPGAETFSIMMPSGSMHTFSTWDDLPSSVKPLAAALRIAILLALGVWFVRNANDTMRQYLVTLGVIQGAGASVVTGPESIGPGVSQAKTAAIALGTTTAIAVAWAAMAVVVDGLMAGYGGGLSGLGGSGSFEWPSQIKVVASFVPVVGILAYGIGHSLLDFFIAPIYFTCVGVIKWLSI